MKSRILSAFASAALASLTVVGTGVAISSAPAQAMPVFDASNYAQNLLTAARTLAQVNNQIQSLQNEAQMLLNQAKNLSKIDFPQLQQLRQRLQEIDQLMGQAQGIAFRTAGFNAQFKSLFAGDISQLGRRDQRVALAKQQLDAAMGAFRQTMDIQNSIVSSVREDADALADIAARSQSAEGVLAAQQATNQLLALSTKQQLQIQTLMASQFRAEAFDQARRGQIESEAREARARFLGDGTVYTPTN
jgi:P-type conjugative transfer protein TrbJ